MTYSDYRRIGRENLKENWALSIGVALIASMLGGLLTGGSFLPDIDYKAAAEQSMAAGASIQLFNTGIALNFGADSFLDLVGFILGGVIQLGYTQYLLKQYNKANFEFRDLFSQFDRFGQGFAQHFLRGLYTALWSLLFIIPGIVKSYSYSMTPYIMAENPEMTASDAIKASMELMNGHKGELFILDLTFIGWDILCALTLNLGHLVLNPYKNAARTAFYKELTSANRIYE